MNLHLAIIFGILLVPLVTTKAENEDSSTNLQGSQLEEKEILREGKFRKIIGFHSRTTYISIRTHTTSAIWTCLSTTAGPCAPPRARELPIDYPSTELRQGRGPPTPPLCGRKRRSINVIEGVENRLQVLSSSNEGGSQNENSLGTENSRSGRRVVLWSTTYSILELTVTSPIPGSTVTVSALRAAVYGHVIQQSCFVG